MARVSTVRRSNAPWWIGLGVILATFIGTVVALNLTLYSPAGFVGTYLAALETKNPDAALATPGVATIPGVSESLLQRESLGELSDIALINTIDDGRDTLVHYSFTLDGLPGESLFRVTHTGMRLGLFNAWKFVESPVSVVEVTPVGDPRFEANGIRLATNAPNESATWQVLTPSVLTLTHNTAYLTAEDRTVLITEPGTLTVAEVEVRASERFVSEVQSEVDDYLTECAAQTVLFPTGCPFGYSVSNRLESPPTWTIATFPMISIVPGDFPGEWLVAGGNGTARVQAEVQSLFDGSVSHLDETVDFTLVWAMTVSTSDAVTITGG
ncbi:MAG TPA: hypothetical protein PK781_07865 [Terrimesophilobacter sp.]|nr:hypothetical protein [Terrimesophilobacter sp.]HRQ00364.1 hypothetical protein [Terrimesophilobacter sp.]